ncbi:MAG: hypothetical protein JW384_00752 [Nitrosomonadaceae bacterium]|nr:hypothetical protein [Nitrosomonadaceae bacterium]
MSVWQPPVEHSGIQHVRDHISRKSKRNKRRLGLRRLGNPAPNERRYFDEIRLLEKPYRVPWHMTHNSLPNKGWRGQLFQHQRIETMHNLTSLNAR